MRRLTYFLSAIMIFGGLNYTYSQVESILDLAVPTALHNVNDTLYIGTYQNIFSRYIIDSGQNVEPLYSISSYRIAKFNRSLYFSNTQGNIHSYNINDDLLKLFYDGGDNIAGLAVYNSTLYFSEFYYGEVRKIGLGGGITIGGSSSIVNSKQFLSGLDTLAAITVYGGHLYITESRTGNILKTDLELDISEIDTVFSNAFNHPNELHNIGDYMYVSEFNGNRISRFDLTAQNPTVEMVVENIDTPTGMASDENFLYISSFAGAEILRIPLNTLSTIQSEPTSESPLIYPNPSNGHIIVSNLQGQKKYKIYSISGKLVQSGVVENDEKIIIENAIHKYYLIQIGTAELVRIIVK